LGAPLLRGKKMDELLANRCSELDTALGRLSLLAAHDALILLGIIQRSKDAAHAALFPVRQSPEPRSACSMYFCEKGIRAICNLDLSDPQWLQASLPVKGRGLAVHRVTSLAPSAF